MIQTDTEVTMKTRSITVATLVVFCLGAIPVFAQRGVQCFSQGF